MENVHLIVDSYKNKNMVKAFLGIARGFIQVLACTFIATVIPPGYLQLLWAFVHGTAFTGLFVLGHDCAHGAFSNSLLLNELIGTLVFAPLLYPYHAWRLTHQHHHNHTNNLKKDYVWRPIRHEDVQTMSFTQKVLRYTFLGPFHQQSSILHQSVHYIPWMFKSKDRLKVVRSIVLAFTILPFALWVLSTRLPQLMMVFELFTANEGHKLLLSDWRIFKALHTMPLVRYWLLPWLIFHFWMSTFTFFHHRHPQSQWKEDHEWDRKTAQLEGTVHIDYPSWIEYLCFDINWHVPHHISTAIPWYNLRQATFALMKSPNGSKIITDVWGPALWWKCAWMSNVWDTETKSYRPLFPLMNLWTEIRWSRLFYFIVVHLGALYGICLLPQTQWTTMVLAIVLYLWSGFGITIGAHRLYAHKAFKANTLFRIFLMLGNTLALQEPIIKWARDHKIHHKYTETNKDPYNAKRGLFFSHFGWLILKPCPEVLEAQKQFPIDFNKEEPVAVWQYKHYKHLLIFAFGLAPTVASLWGDAWNAFWVAGMLRLVLVYQATWCVNSFAHYYGEKYDFSRCDARNNTPVSIAALGEGTHAYHHYAPSDYTTAEYGNGWTFNPSTMVIDAAAALGWVWDRKRYSLDVSSGKLKAL